MAFSDACQRDLRRKGKKVSRKTAEAGAFREDSAGRKARARKIVGRLKALFPDAACSLAYSNPLELLIATILEGCSIPTASTLLDKLVALTVDAQERARILGILYAVVIVFTSPFGWIAGRVSEINRSLPFVLTMALFGIGGLLIYLASRPAKGNAAIEPLAGKAAQV